MEVDMVCRALISPHGEVVAVVPVAVVPVVVVVVAVVPVAFL